MCGDTVVIFFIYTQINSRSFLFLLHFAAFFHYKENVKKYYFSLRPHFSSAACVPIPLLPPNFSIYSYTASIHVLRLQQYMYVIMTHQSIFVFSTQFHVSSAATSSSSIPFHGTTEQRPLAFLLSSCECKTCPEFQRGKKENSVQEKKGKDL